MAAINTCLPDVIQAVDLAFAAVGSLCFIVRGSSVGRSSCCSVSHFIRYTSTHEQLSHMGVNDVGVYVCVCVLNLVSVLRAKLSEQYLQWKTWLYSMNSDTSCSATLDYVLQPNKFKATLNFHLNFSTMK